MAERAVRDVNDMLRAGELDLDVESAKIDIGEVSLEDAEDLWLTIICLTPARADYSRVQDAHLGHRARIVLNIIRAHVLAGWPQVSPEHLQGELAAKVRADYWSTLKVKCPPAFDLRSIPARLRNFNPENISLETAEEVLIRAWYKTKYIAVHRHTATLAETKGIEEADSWHSERRARMAALSAGIKWRSFGEVADVFLDQLRRRIMSPDESTRLLGSGFPALDRMVRHWGPKKFTVVAGWNGHGKSTLIAQLLSQMAIQNFPGFYISGEDEMLITVERIARWALVDLHAARRIATGRALGPEGYTRADLYAIEHAIDRLRNIPLQLLHLPNATLGQVKAAIVDGARAGAVIGAHDYLSTIKQPESWDVTDWRNHCVKEIKAAFVENGLHGLEGAQLTRPKDRDDTGRPTRFMIDHCPAAEHAAEYILLVRRHQKNDRKVGQGVEDAEIIVDKAKDAEVGVLEVGWCRTQNRYEYRTVDAKQQTIADKGVYSGEGAKRDDDDF